MSFLSEWQFPLRAFACLLVGAAVVACAAKAPSAVATVSSSAVATPARMYLGPPGTPPPGANVSGQVGVYTFASLDNYCHMARWIISGTVLSDYENEARPVLIRRNTPVQVVGKEDTHCTYRGQSMDVEDHTLSKVLITAGPYKSAERYALPESVYSQADYDDYTKRVAQEKQFTKRLIASASAKPKELPNDDHFGKVYTASIVILDDDVWGPEIDQSLQGMCQGMAYQHAHATGKDPTFAEMQRIAPGYDEFRNNESLRVIGGPTEDPCLHMTYYKVRLLGPPARGGSTTGWVAGVHLNDYGSKP